MMIRINRNEDRNIILLFSYLTISLISKLFQDFLGINRIFSYVLFLFIMFWTIINNLRRITKDILLFYVVLIPIFVFGVIQNVSYIPFVDIASMFVNVLPAYYIYRINISESNFYRVHMYAVIVNLLGYIPLSVLTDNYMDYAYHVAFNGCIALCIYLYKRDIKMLIAFLLAVGVVLLFGARGAILCTVIFLTYSLYKTFCKKKIVVLFASIVVATILALTYEQILLILHQMYPDSRVLTSIIQGSFFQSDGRIELYEYCYELVKKNKWGYGPLSTRHLILWQPYPHSLVYELLVDYGVVLGGIVLVAIVFFGVKLAFKNDAVSRIGACYFILGFSMLMISGSIYYNAYLYIAFAIYVSCIKRRRINHEEKNF